VLVQQPQDFGAIVRERRTSQRLTQAELAHRAGVSRPSLARIEAGHQRAELDIVLKIAWALGLEMSLDDAPAPSIDLDAHLEHQARGS
jgi:y4mF family transcriptional regulator